MVLNILPTDIRCLSTRICCSLVMGHAPSQIHFGYPGITGAGLEHLKQEKFCTASIT